jgi:hypothetical protein
MPPKPTGPKPTGPKPTGPKPAPISAPLASAVGRISRAGVSDAAPPSALLEVPPASASVAPSPSATRECTAPNQVVSSSVATASHVASGAVAPEPCRTDSELPAERPVDLASTDTRSSATPGINALRKPVPATAPASAMGSVKPTLGSHSVAASSTPAPIQPQHLSHARTVADEPVSVVLPPPAAADPLEVTFKPASTKSQRVTAAAAKPQKPVPAAAAPSLVATAKLTRESNSAAVPAIPATFHPHLTLMALK